MLNGNNFPQNVRALLLFCRRIATECFGWDGHCINACRYRLGKLWIDVVIKPVFIRMLRKRRLALWLLSCRCPISSYLIMWTIKLFQLESTERLLTDVSQCLLKEDYIKHPDKTFWNWVGQTCTSKRHWWGTYITAKPETMKTWALSLHPCIQIEADIARMCDKDILPLSLLREEEIKSMIAADTRDTEFNRKKHTMSLDPLN